MKLFEGKTPAERNKTILALLLPLIAAVLLLRMFFASDPPKPAPTKGRNANATKGGVARPQPGAPAADSADGADEIAMPQPIDWAYASVNAPDASRNIFAFYVPPTPGPTPPPTEAPTPTPTPPPPVMLGAVQPASVYARTEAFTLELSGDKFTPQTGVFMDGQPLPTTFKSPQQLTAQVPAAIIQSAGTRAVMVRTPDGALFSNTSAVNVMAPPTPQYTFTGIIGRRGYADKAILKPTSGNELLTVQRGDVVGGRFKVTSISERAVDFTDTQLKIKHTVPYSETKGLASGPGSRQPPPPPADDDEP